MSVFNSLLGEQLRQIKRFVFGYQSFEIEILKLGLFFLIKSEIRIIQNAVRRVALVTRHTDLLFFNIAMEKTQLRRLFRFRQRMLFPVVYFCRSGIPGIDPRPPLAVLDGVYRNTGNETGRFFSFAACRIENTSERLPAETGIFRIVPLVCRTVELLFFVVTYLTRHKADMHV